MKYQRFILTPSGLDCALYPTWIFPYSIYEDDAHVSTDQFTAVSHLPRGLSLSILLLFIILRNVHLLW